MRGYRRVLRPDCSGTHCKETSSTCVGLYQYAHRGVKAIVRGRSLLNFFSPRTSLFFSPRNVPTDRKSVSSHTFAHLVHNFTTLRSEERRVGKEYRTKWWSLN